MRGYSFQAFYLQADPSVHGQPQQGNSVAQEWPTRAPERPGDAASASLDDGTDAFSSCAGPQHPVLLSRAGMRQLSGSESAADCIAQFLELAEKEDSLAVLMEDDCIALISAAVDRGNFKLAKVQHCQLT
jgi:hypothetical protein